MSILSGFKKVRRRIRLPDGYKLLSFWTSSQTVEMDDGTTLESNKAKWDDASNKKHEHTNKPALDSITSEKVANWNTLAESNVTGVKGNTESSYRTGNVNLTSANIGALPTTGGTLTGNIYPATNNNSSVGTSSYKWANMYATTFHGSLDGNAANADKLNGYSVTKWGGIPCIGTDGVMEIGKYIDFHNTNNNNDFDVRLTSNNVSANGMGLTMNVSNSTSSVSLRCEGNWGGMTGSNGWIFYNDKSSGKNIFNGTATKATQDGNGNTISNTYWNKTTDLVIIRDLSLNPLTVLGYWDGRTTGTVVNISNYKPIAAIAKDTCSGDVCWMYCYLDPDGKTVRAGIKNTIGNDKTLSPIAHIIYLRTS